MIEPEAQVCPLCGGTHIDPYHAGKARDYLHCATCDLVFVPSYQHLSDREEKAYYDLHDNQPDDPGYRRFLDRLFTPLLQRLTPNAQGLDFGSGPGPTLSKMFEAAGHPVALYDPYYAPDKAVLSAAYDFITLSEVAEHLAQPGTELDRLWARLAPGGWLGIMTKRVRDQTAFKTWHYITDPTHIAFFSEATFQWLAGRWSAMGTPAALVIAGNDVVLIGKS
ncbi:MAG: methyltransferase domain-containing protein [Alphaproteobacteria bacterium]|nr:methyltransferase domain-containing protein [Alphaproteobacteria bacterium]